MTNIKRKTFTHAGLTLSYLDNECASDDLPIVLLHGFTASAKINWLDSGWMDALTQAQRRVIAPDARGHGESNKPYDSAYYPAHLMMEDSVALLAQLGFERADFAGFSMGARMATFVAMSYPNKVRKLMIGGLGSGMKTGIGNPEPIAAALRADNPNEVKNRHARRFRRIAEKCGNDLEAMACCILSSRQAVTDELLANITAKTCIIVGAEDLTGGDPHTLAPLIADATALSIPACNHFNALTHEAFQRAGIEFLTT